MRNGLRHHGDMGRARVLAVLALAAVSACGAREHEPRPTPSVNMSVSAAPTPEPTARATSAVPGSTPPAWLGRRPLPRASNGLGEIRPTPPELRDRRFTLPDQLPPLPGDG
ncbi:MAG TPA: hypothetical protein VM093_01760, partial [Aeromicrobium sp.]|nr:hypothetical protein [Aeromicrobium sp.]